MKDRERGHRGKERKKERERQEPVNCQLKYFVII